MRNKCVFYAAMLVAAMSQTLGAEESARVGHYGDSSRLAIEGARSYDPAEIARALATNVDVAYASCADHPLTELKAVLADMVRQAYLRKGFADIRVAVRQEPSRLVLAIEEGRQFQAGEIRFPGARSIDVQALGDGLAKERDRGSLEDEVTKLQDLLEDESTTRDGRSKKQTAFWPIGEPAPLDELRRQDLQERVENLLSDEGYFGARFSLSPELDRQRGTAILNVVIAKEGIRETAANLGIVGNERNSREAILNYVGVRADTALTDEVRSRIEKALNESGRFVKVQWRASPETAPRRQRLELGEYDQAPSLDQPLSREEAALVKVYRWTQEFNEGADEITADVATEEIRGGFVSAPDAGFVAWIGGLPGAQPPVGNAPPTCDLALISTDAEIGVYSYRRGRKLASAVMPAPVMLLLSWTLAVGPPELNGRGAFTFGLGTATNKLRKKRHCEFRFAQSAVGAVSLAHQKDATFRWQGDLLTIERTNWRFVIDARTGRLLDCAQVGGVTESQTARMFFSQGEFQRKLRELKASASGLNNFAAPRFPVSCIAAYACDEAAYWSAAAKAGWIADFANVIRKLVDRGLLAPFDQALLVPDSPDPKFTLAFRTFSANSKDNLPGLISGVMRYRGVEFTNRLAPRGSWPWQMAREAMFVGSGKKDGLAHALDSLDSDASGPIRCLAASLLLNAAEYETEACKAASAGVKRTSLAQFRNDYRPLLERGYYAADSLLRLAQMLRELDEAEVDSLVRGAAALGVLDHRGSQLLVEAARRLRQQPGEPVDRLLPPILDDLWRAGLQDYVEQALESAAIIPESAVWDVKLLHRRLREIEELQKQLKQSDLPPEELQRRLKKIDELERQFRESAPSTTARRPTHGGK